MDPVTAAFQMLAAFFRLLEQAYIDWNTSPEGPLKVRRRERIDKLESLFDPLLDHVVATIQRLHPPAAPAIAVTGGQPK